MATLQEITSESAFNDTVSALPSTHLAVLYFHTPWAAPCTQMRTILTTLASTYTTSSPIAFLSINAEDLPEISENYDVTAVPFLVLQRDGKTLETVSGSDATKVRSAVERHVGGSGGSKVAIPPPLEATRQNGAAGGVTKDLSGYAPGESDAKTAPEYSSGGGEQEKEELNKRLEGLVKAAPVMLFMKGTPSAPQCGFSRQLVSILRENSVKYGFFNILADDEVRQGLKEYSEWPTFPQLYTNGDLIGGLDIVREEMEADADFFTPFSTKAEGGGPAAPQMQAQAASATA